MRTRQLEEESEIRDRTLMEERMKGGFRAVMHFVDGSVQDFEYADGRDLIHSWISDDWGAPPTTLVLRAKTEDGRLVMINTPYDQRGAITASIEE